MYRDEKHSADGDKSRNHHALQQRRPGVLLHAECQHAKESADADHQHGSRSRHESGST